VPEPRLGISVPEFDRPSQGLFAADRITAAQQYLAQVTVGLSLRWGELADLDEGRLSFGQQSRIQVHATDGQHHRVVVAVPRFGSISYLAQQLGLMRSSEMRTERQRGFGVRILSPARDQFV
jgi:hypothetical protein